MSSMKQLADQILGNDEVVRIHALTSASFPDSSHSPSRPWGVRARRPQKTRIPGKLLDRHAGSRADPTSRDRWPELTICRDFDFRSVRAVLRRRLAPQCRVLLCLDEMPADMRMMHRVILAGADAVLVHSDVLARAAHALGVPASRIVLANSRNDLAPFDHSARSRATQPRASGVVSRIIHVGDLEPEAGVADFLLCVAAWAECNPQRRVGIQWCGEGCLRGILEAQPLPPNVQQSFPGPVARKDLAAMFLDCDALALPALADPWDDTVLEALTAHLPVLGSTRSRTVVDLIVQGVSGWMFDPFESGAMARAVELALNAMPDELDRMRAHAAERPKPSLPGLSERIWRAMRLEGSGPEFDPASLGLAS